MKINDFEKKQKLDDIMTMLETIGGAIDRMPERVKDTYITHRDYRELLSIVLMIVKVMRGDNE